MFGFQTLFYTNFFHLLDPDLLYHGPESETSDETDFDEVNFPLTTTNKITTTNSAEMYFDDNGQN